MWNYQSPPSSEELFHYGVMGMKWGVRRYQDKGGGRTLEGKTHYGKSAKESDQRLMSRIKGDDDGEGYQNLMGEISSKSGDWYWSKGVSEAFKKALSDHDATRDAIDRKYNADLASKQARTRFREVLKQYHPEDQVTDNKKFNDAFDKANNDPMYKELRSKYEKISQQNRKARSEHAKRYMDELAGIVLKDLGYENTARGRKFLLDKNVIFWD